jgi:hypothetical protein
MLLNVSDVCSQRFTTMGQQTMAASLGIHVTDDLGILRVQPISDRPLPARPGDNTPRTMDDWGENHAGPSKPTPDYLGSRTR